MKPSLASHIYRVSHYNDDHHGPGDTDSGDGDADYNYIGNDVANDATSDVAYDVWLMMLHAYGTSAYDADADAD